MEERLIYTKGLDYLDESTRSHTMTYSKYVKTFVALGGQMYNVRSLWAHYLYGSNVLKLAQMSKIGIVYNP